MSTVERGGLWRRCGAFCLLSFFFALPQHTAAVLSSVSFSFPPPSKDVVREEGRSRQGSR
jgi:hypothetical protein